MFYNLLDTFTYVSPLILFTGICIGINKYKFLDPVHKIMVVYMGICLLMDAVSRIYGKLTGNNLVFIIIFSLAELLIMYVLYRQCLLLKKKTVYIVVFVVATAYILWELWNSQYIEPQSFQSYARVVDGFAILIYSISFFFERIGDNNDSRPDLLRINSAMMIYYSLHLILFLPINFLINIHTHIKFYLWSVNLLVTLVFYSFLVWEIWKNGLILKQSHSGLQS